MTLPQPSRSAPRRRRRRGQPSILVVVIALLLSGCGAQSAASLLAPPPITAVPSGLPQSPAQADQQRAELATALFGTPDLSGAKQGTTVVTPANQDSIPLSLRPLVVGTYILTVPLKFELSSNVRVLIPAAPRHCVLLWHGGHAADAYISGGEKVVQDALLANCRVAVLDMPLHGANAGIPARTTDGRIVDPQRPDPYSLHNDLTWLDPDNTGAALSLFIAPVVATVDHFLTADPASDITLAGFSGGGWTTTVAAAVDPRIRHSVEVAGSQPFTELNSCAGDYEQCHPALYGRVSMMQMYVLASQGLFREHVQFLNYNDTCCYSHIDGKAYTATVQQSVTASGGGLFLMFPDYTLQTHAIPAAAQGWIAAWLKR